MRRDEVVRRHDGAAGHRTRLVEQGQVAFRVPAESRGVYQRRGGPDHPAQGVEGVVRAARRFPAYVRDDRAGVRDATGQRTADRAGRNRAGPLEVGVGAGQRGGQPEGRGVEFGGQSVDTGQQDVRLADGALGGP